MGIKTTIGNKGVVSTPTDGRSSLNIDTLEGNAVKIQQSKLDLYVSINNGNDNNSGLSSNAPLKTIQQAYSLIPKVLEAPVVIHLDSGDHVHDFFGERLQPSINSRIWIYGDGAGQSGDDGFTVLKATETAQAGTSTAKIVTTGSLTIDEYKGKTVEIVSGTGAGNRRLIRNNTATDIIPVAVFTAADNTSEYRVVEPGAKLVKIITGAGTKRQSSFSGLGRQTNLGSNTVSFNLVNLSLDYSGSGNFFHEFVDVGVNMFGVDASQITNVRFINSTVNFAKGDNLPSIPNVYEDLGFSTTRENLWNGWGTAAGNQITALGGDIEGYANAFALFSGQQSAFTVFGGSFGYIQADLSSLNISGDSTIKTIVSTTFNFAGIVIATFGGQIELSNVDINNLGAGAALYTEGNGTIYWDSANVAGGSAGGYGIDISKGGRVIFNGALGISGSNPGTNDVYDGVNTVGIGIFSGSHTGITNLSSVVHRLS